MNRIFNNTTAFTLRSKIVDSVLDMECKSTYDATRGIIDEGVDEEIFDLMFIHTFLPYWEKPVVDKIKCLLADNYNIK